MSAVAANLHAGVGAGRERDPWEIKRQMDLLRITQADVAQKAGIKSHSVVSRTINGVANNEKVLRALVSYGVGVECLSLPEKIAASLDN